MKTILIKILIPIIINYLVIAFIKAEYNTNLWNEGTRFILVLISSLTIFSIYAYQKKTIENYENN